MPVPDTGVTPVTGVDVGVVGDAVGTVLVGLPVLVHMDKTDDSLIPIIHIVHTIWNKNDELV